MIVNDEMKKAVENLNETRERHSKAIAALKEAEGTEKKEVATARRNLEFVAAVARLKRAAAVLNGLEITIEPTEQESLLDDGAKLEVAVREIEGSDRWYVRVEYVCPYYDANSLNLCSNDKQSVSLRVGEYWKDFYVYGTAVPRCHDHLERATGWFHLGGQLAIALGHIDARKFYDDTLVVEISISKVKKGTKFQLIAEYDQE